MVEVLHKSIEFRVEGFRFRVLELGFTVLSFAFCFVGALRA